MNANFTIILALALAAIGAGCSFDGALAQAGQPEHPAETLAQQVSRTATASTATRSRLTFRSWRRSRKSISSPS